MGRKKRLLRVGLVGAGALAGLLLVLGLLAKSVITKEWLIQEIEKSINSKVEMGEVDVSLLSFPAKVTIRDVSLSLRDGQKSAEPPVQIGEASLSLGVWGLLRRHIDVTNITIRDAAISNTCYKDGTTSLQKLFESPDEQKRKKRRGEKNGGGFNIYEQEEFVTTLGGLSIENATFELILEGMGLRLLCQDLNAEMSSIKIDPQDLETTNHGELSAKTRVRVDSDKGRQYADLHVQGSSKVRIFDPETGDVQPELRGALHLADESWLSAEMPFITRAWNSLAVLEKIGVKVGRLPVKARFGRSKSVSAHYHAGKVTLEKALSIWLDDWEVAVLEGGWLNSQTDQHEAHVELLASKEASKLLGPLVFKAVDVLPEQIKTEMTTDLRENLFRENRLMVKIKSTGEFSKPAVRVVSKIVQISKAAKDAAKELLDKKAGELLKGLLE